MTEAQGHWVLELRAPDGKLVRALTTPDFGLRNLVGFAGKFAIVEAGTDPKLQDIYKVPLDGGAPEKLTTGKGVSDAKANTRHHYRPQLDPLPHLVAMRGESRHDIPNAQEKPSLLPSTIFETVELDGRTHHVAITRPRNFDRSRRYPVILKVYAGPHVTYVQANRDSYVMDQWYADAGFIVVRSDNRGTPRRGRAWERAILKDLITAPLADQEAALRAVGARHRELDLDRVGVVGWSFGGYFSAMPSSYAPSSSRPHRGRTGQRLDALDTRLYERYMKTPRPTPVATPRRAPHARRKLARARSSSSTASPTKTSTSPTRRVHRGPLRRASVAEVITLSATHMVPDPKLNLAREQVQIDFLRTHLALPARRDLVPRCAVCRRRQAVGVATHRAGPTTTTRCCSKSATR